MNDELIFAPEEPIQESTYKEKWKVLIVDDEADVHKITKLALDNFVFKNKTIEYFDAYSAKEAEQVLSNNSDIALVLLDVVMETVHAGLDLVKVIRRKLNNSIIRIILRTGQAGQAPEKEVILNYEIDDYKSKIELTNVRLFTVILTGLRNYDVLKQLENYNQDLENKIAERTKEITDSIKYAGYIQTAVLPRTDFIKSIFPEHFLLYRPKNIVGGDFYWFYRQNNKVIFAVADCTGHGVPGAFMSMLGVSILNEIVNNNKYIPANEILNELRENVIKVLHQKDSQLHDGMDIALCSYDIDRKKLCFAGANNPLWIVRSVAQSSGLLSDEPEVRDTEHTNQRFVLQEVKPDNMPIGSYFSEDRSFTLQDVKIESGDIIYMFSDGYKDQFGGSDNKKFKSKQLKELLVANCNKSMPEQKQILERSLQEWIGKNEQTDDILIFGVKL